MYETIIKHYPLEKRESRKVKKVKLRRENYDKKRANAESHGSYETTSSGKKLQPI